MSCLNFGCLHKFMNILLVEDYDALREVTSEVLSSCGHRVHALASAEDLDEVALRQPYDLAVLDLNLPGEDGLALASRLRRVFPGIGIVMVTVRHTLPDKLAGYEHGADVYLTKPTAPEELCAAIHALGKRMGLLQAPSEVASACRLLLLQASLHTPKGPIALRQPEVAVLQGLALAPQGFLEYWQLLQILDKPVDDVGKAQLEVLVSRLRAKLQALQLPEPGIKSERGRGYRLCFPIQLV